MAMKNKFLFIEKLNRNEELPSHLISEREIKLNLQIQINR